MGETKGKIITLKPKPRAETQGMICLDFMFTAFLCIVFISPAYLLQQQCRGQRCPRQPVCFHPHGFQVCCPGADEDHVSAPFEWYLGLLLLETVVPIICFRCFVFAHRIRDMTSLPYLLSHQKAHGLNDLDVLEIQRN